MRSDKVLIRLSASERKTLHEAASTEGIGLATWARTQLLRTAKSTMTDRRTKTGNGADKRPILLSLFCGPGGLDTGFEASGFRTAVALDIEPDAVRTFQYNHPDSVAAVESVTGLTLRKLDELHGSEFAPVGVLGGPPCQSFSVSNVHQTDDDPRHLLPEAYANLLRKLNARRPISFFVFENVPGLLGKKHAHRYTRFKRMFEKAGFLIREQLLDAADFGVPQVRPRIIIVGINQRIHPGKTWIPPKPSKKRATVSDTIRGFVEPVHNARGLDPDSFELHANHWCLVPKSSKFADKKLKQGDMWGRSFRTLRWDEPSWTVAYGHREVHVHPDGHRRLSIYEAMLLQSFPHAYRLLGNMTAQVKLVSDAVPPLLARKVADSIRNSLGI